jgi:hypothetical protein
MSTSREQIVKTYQNTGVKREEIESSLNGLLKEGYKINRIYDQGPILFVVLDKEADYEMIGFSELKRRIAENTPKGRILSGDEVYRLVARMVDEIMVRSVPK